MPRQSERWNTPLQGNSYSATPPSLTDGQSAPGQVDANGNQKVTQATLVAGEDITNDVMKVEQRYSYTTLTSSSTVVAKSGAGHWHGFSLGFPSCPTISFYDNTVPGGTLIYRIHAGYPVGTYELNISVLTGLTADAVGSGAGAAPMLLISTR